MQRFIIGMALVMLGVGMVQADVEVVEGNISFTRDTLFNSSDYMAIIQQNQTGDETGVFFDYDGTDLVVTDYYLDEGEDLYLVNEGDEFSKETIQNGGFPFLRIVFNPVKPPVTVGSGDFYLGVNTGDFDGPDGPERDVYGWLHIGNVDGELVQLGDAMAYGGTGIIVGTTVGIIPEPSTIILLLTGALGFLGIAWRRRK